VYSRPSSSDETGDRLQDMLILVFCRTRCRVSYNLPDNILCFDRRVTGCRQGNVVRQPDVEVEPILNILGKELLLKMRGKKAADHKKYQRAQQDAPAVSDGATDKFVVEAVEAPLSLLLDAELFLFWWPQDVVAQERDKSHGNDQRAQQRNGHHDGKAAEELSGVASQHQEGKIGDDVGNGGIEDRGRQLCRTKPRRDTARQAIRETALDTISGNHRHIDQQPQRDNERRHRNLL
jgi:hypothetical protein